MLASDEGATAPVNLFAALRGTIARDPERIFLRRGWNGDCWTRAEFAADAGRVAAALAPFAGGRFAAGLLMTCIYEFCHCIQHLSYKPKHPWLAEMKRRHLAHHFHDEDGNFGITSFWPDRLFGTDYERSDRPEKSPKVFNLGYTEEVAKSFPWVSRMSGGVAKGHPRKRAAANENGRSRQDAA